MNNKGFSKKKKKKKRKKRKRKEIVSKTVNFNVYHHKSVETNHMASAAQPAPAGNPRRQVVHEHVVLLWFYVRTTSFDASFGHIMFKQL